MLWGEVFMENIINQFGTPIQASFYHPYLAVLLELHFTVNIVGATSSNDDAHNVELIADQTI
jgi:hypothetical protein